VGGQIALCELLVSASFLHVIGDVVVVRSPCQNPNPWTGLGWAGLCWGGGWRSAAARAAAAVSAQVTTMNGDAATEAAAAAEAA
jgi:hypothetical protein